MRDARQRSILAGLGIPLWVPRLLGTRKQQTASAAIWRDQVTPDTDTSAVSSSPSPQPTAIVLSVEKPVVTSNAQQPAIKQTEVAQPPKVSDPVVSNTAALPEFSDLVEAPDSLSSQPLLRFSVQAVELNHWVVLVDEQTLQDTATKQLWGNICAAFGNPEQLRFNWPLADGLRWQHPQGAKAALNGFLFRLGMDKRVGLMGQLPDDVMPDRIERLPALQELLEQPLKKRSLWSLLKQQ